MPSTNLLPLRKISTAEFDLCGPCLLKIRSDQDVQTWKRTTGYRDYAVFLRRLNESVVGVFMPPPSISEPRFGNLAFRTWGKRLEEQADNLLESLLPQDLRLFIPLLKPYFVTGYGHFTRMDYGTGHETSFALFLLCLALIRFLQPQVEEERQIVLLVFVRYLRLCWRLQDVYHLEPAGSHGVWGLDDSSFLGYIFGSAQLREQQEIPVSAVLQRDLPPTNLYFLQISRIRQVKHGPFHEHSSQLHSIAVGVPNWGKVNSGLFKMYEAEVLGKRVVVQHIPLGGLLAWDVEDHPLQPSGVPRASVPGSGLSDAGTRAPWANEATVTGAPWASR
ncbi:Phosphotyrosyl phosphatase activator [Heliocybe sulcata]|uniref:Serine/threonine-protein phosphatase 2A activator n=1 Tax=Heliocybe sulcata TaxID=5364 RepID=A0A5C3N270_9AGAM|nr:Phosphotyrosyl phosphatase activator [Heliocybe sulcata]